MNAVFVESNQLLNFNNTINQLNEDVGLERIQIIAADGPSDYMRPILNKMDDETFELFITLSSIKSAEF